MSARLSRLDSLFGIGLFTTLVIVVALVAVATYWQPTRTALPVAGTALESAPLHASVTKEGLAATLAQVAACGTRTLGQPGCDAMADVLIATCKQAGAEVVEMPVQTPVPITDICTLVPLQGAAPTGLHVVPFKPNQLQPAVTAVGGLIGRLVLVDEAWTVGPDSGRGCIALVDAAKPSQALGFTWSAYAARGFEGVIIAHHDGLGAIAWNDVCAQAESCTPVVFPRAAASAEIFALAGSEVRLDMHATWRSVTHRAVLARLRSTRPSISQAVVVTVSYDQVAAVPGLIPSSNQDLPLAAAMSLITALGAQRDQLGRDVIIVATAGSGNGFDGLAWLLSAAGPMQEAGTNWEWWRNRVTSSTSEKSTYENLLAPLATPGMYEDAQITTTVLAALSDDQRTHLAALQRLSVNDLVMDAQEEGMVSRLAMVRAAPAPGMVSATSLVDASIAATQHVGRIKALATWPAVHIAQRSTALAKELHLAQRMHQRAVGLVADATAHLVQATAAVTIGEIFAGYPNAISVLQFQPAFGPEQEVVALHRGERLEPGPTGQAFSELAQRLVTEAGSHAPQLRPMAGIRGYADHIDAVIGRLPLQTTHWNGMGYPAISVVHADRNNAYRNLTSPKQVIIPGVATAASGVAEVIPAEVLPVRHLRLCADLLATLAAGREEIPAPQRAAGRAFGGKVLADGVGAGLVPDHPLPGMIVSARTIDRQPDARVVGYSTVMNLQSDGLGRYGVPAGTFNIIPVDPPAQVYTPLTAGFSANGEIRWIKDQGTRSQAIFKSESINSYNPPLLINLIAFRGEPVIITDRIDPRQLAAWAGIKPLTREGLNAPPSLADFDNVGGVSAYFLSPDRPVFFTLNAGSPEEPLVQKVRSLLLGAAVPAGTKLTSSQPDGVGYLPADRPWIRDVAADASASLLRLQGPMLQQQIASGLVRDGVREVADQAQSAQTEAANATNARSALQASRRAGALAQKNRQSLQETVSQAVANILWYLLLLVPFALFAEKLVIGSSDVRRQIAWSSGIFLGAFALLAFLHPAFSLLSSPAMILLGFVIMLIALAVSTIFLGRFQENLRSIQSQRGQVNGTGVDVLGVTVTAFMLGLNGLSRRKVRTGLTSATLVLITFALICFAGATRREGIDVTAVGPAAYPGMLVQGEGYAAVSNEALSALRARYAPQHLILARTTLVGTEEWSSKERSNPQVDLTLKDGSAIRVSRCQSMLLWDHQEPLAARLRLVSGSTWASVTVDPKDKRLPVMVSEEVASELRLDLTQLGTSAPITLNGQSVVVVGVFASDSLAGVRDLNGLSPLPFDIEAAVQVRRDKGGQVVSTSDDPLIAASRIVIAPSAGLTATIPKAEARLVSCAVAFQGLTYRQANEVITEHQRLSGQKLAYGLDGTAYVGRPRVSGGFGGIDLIIPLLIAALTVLNTMRGSVYERRDEIAVFNAVGIAPRFIAMMFFAEALVYAVVGAVAGYLLSLVLGRGLAMAGWDAGLKLDVASLAPVYASLALAAAVFLSTWFPARQAAEIAAPSDDSGWKVPEPVDDRMVIELPFAFDVRDRVGILAFFARWFRDHGEGGGGIFQANEPILSAMRDGADAIPSIAARIWLKPFDQGVSQELKIELRPNQHGESIAYLSITRTNGTREAWMRLNRPFMTVLRRHFLHWRAVDAPMRVELFDEACGLLRTSALQEKTHVSA